MTGEDIDQFCKMMYEKIMIDYIIHASEREVGTYFIVNEMNDDSFVHIISFQFLEECIELHTEGDVNGEDTDTPWISIPSSDHRNEIESKMEELHTNILYTDRRVREWYESYMIPRLEAALKAVNM